MIERLEGPPTRAEAITEEILREYLMWCGERLTADHGVVFDDTDAAVAAHHREFTRELPHLLGPRGRLLVARANSEVVGVGALRPVDATVAEIKRMYVRPQARGQGVGRAILERLLADARTIGYRVARLETATFMREAHALYRSLGFQDRPIFDRTEASLSGLESFMLFMELRLPPSGPRNERRDVAEEFEMTQIPGRLSIVTLGARNMRVLRPFYRSLGWPELPTGDDTWTGFFLGGVMLALFPIGDLTAEAAPGSPDPSGWTGVTLACAVDNREAVDTTFAAAVAAGATPVADAVDRPWGGRSAFVADPEGNRWEFIWSPRASFDGRGSLLSW